MQKSEFVLDLVGLVHDDEDKALVFCWPQEEQNPLGPQLMLPPETWEEMGKPSVITVAVSRDDLLNEGESDAVQE